LYYVETIFLVIFLIDLQTITMIRMPRIKVILISV